MAMIEPPAARRMEVRNLDQHFPRIPTDHAGKSSHPPPAPRCGWGAARGRSERPVLMFQKSEKRDVAGDCPASRARIIHGKA